MRRSLPAGLALVTPVLLAGCTGTGLFFDHTLQWFGHNPNSPAGNSQTLQRIRGDRVEIAPILPEPGNVWPGPQSPDPTLDELSRQQAASGQRSGPDSGAAASPRASAPASRANASRGQAGPPASSPPSIGVEGGSARGYRQMQPPSPSGQGILVPNGNGTSTLINPDGSIQTVPTPR